MKQDYLNILRSIKSVSMATVDANGHPQVRIIDVMLVENQKLYFCTARGKDFYKELIDTKRVAIVAMTKNYQTIRLNGEVEQLTSKKKWIDKIFENNPSMNSVYPHSTRYILEPFCIQNATIEYFDLSHHPIYREYDSIGDWIPLKKGYEIQQNCISCGLCLQSCPQQSIIQTSHQYQIIQEHCLHCGQCVEKCPVKAIKRRDSYAKRSY